MLGVDSHVPIALQDRTKKSLPASCSPPATVIDPYSVEVITHDGHGHVRRHTSRINLRLALLCYCSNFGSFANKAADATIKAAAVNKDPV
jgi:hypothetical protein